MTSSEDKERYPLLVVQRETSEMSQLSRLGLEAATARMRLTNPELYRYLSRLHEMLPDLVTPVYNLILLEYEIKRKDIPRVTDKTITEYDEDEANNEERILPAHIYQEELRNAMLAEGQQVLADVVDNYLNGLDSLDPVLKAPTFFGIRHTYFLLRKQAIKDQEEPNRQI